MSLARFGGCVSVLGDVRLRVAQGKGDEMPAFPISQCLPPIRLANS
jgi:hypothetical protein